MNKKVVGIGEILWDMIPSEEEDGGIRKQLGGAPANFAFHAHSLGMNGIPVSSVGSDENGREMIDQLNALGLTSDLIGIDEEHPTGTVTVELDGKGVPCYYIHTDTAWDYVHFSRNLMKLAEEADAVCFGSF